MAVKHALLALLARGSAGTYQLRKDFETATGTTWPLNIGQVATTLARLERDGLVVRLEPGRSADAPSAPASNSSVCARTYAKTPYARAQNEELGGSAVEAPPATTTPTTSPATTTLTASNRDVVAWALTDVGRAELANWWARPVQRRVPDRDELVIKLALAAATPGVDVTALIQQQRQSTQTSLHEINRARRAAVNEDLAATLVLDHHVFVIEAELRWLDDVEGRLARAAASTTPTAPTGSSSAGPAAPTGPTAPTGPATPAPTASPARRRSR